MDDLKKLLGGGVNTVRRNVINPVHRGLVGAVQAINPWDAQSAGGDLVNEANSRYGFTPEFMQNLKEASPQLVNGQIGSELLDSGEAGATYSPQSPWNNSINISKFNTPQRRDQTDALLHEGLHRVWDKQPQTQQEFIKAYNQGASPELRSYLVGRLGGYKNFNNSRTDSLMDLSMLQSDLQNEVHSYIPDYYQQNPNTALNGPLADYYKRYYDISRPTSTKEVSSYLMKQYPSMFPPSTSVAGLSPDSGGGDLQKLLNGIGK